MRFRIEDLEALGLIFIWEEGLGLEHLPALIGFDDRLLQVLLEAYWKGFHDLKHGTLLKYLLLVASVLQDILGACKFNLVFPDVQLLGFVNLLLYYKSRVQHRPFNVNDVLIHGGLLPLRGCNLRRTRVEGHDLVLVL